MIFETERLVLRPWREDDAENLYKYAKDPDVGPAAGWPAHTSVENSRQTIKNVLSAPETYAVCLKTSGETIGSIGLKTGDATDMTDRADECELGYWLGKPHWGKGIIPEAAKELIRYAFEDLGMRAIWCGHYDGNIKSRRVMEKLGFVYHHTTEGVEVALLGEIRTGHVTLLTKEKWVSMYQRSENMTFLELAKERYSVRSFKNDMIEDEKLNAIIEAGHMAPTACNYQPQKIYVVKSEENRKKLAEVCRYTFDAPVILVVAYDKERDWKNRLMPGYSSGETDAAIVCTHMMLEAWEQGIGSCWVGYFNADEVENALGLPENICVTAMLPIGYAAEGDKPSGLHSTYRDYEDVVTVM